MNNVTVKESASKNKADVKSSASNEDRTKKRDMKHKCASETKTHINIFLC